MKKLIVIISSIVLIGLASSEANAQVRFGGGLAYGEGISDIGISANALFDLGGSIDVQPSFTYFLTSSLTTFWEINGDVHYNFSDSESTDFYAIGGLNVTHFGVNLDIFGVQASGAVNEIGANLGLGATFNKGANISPFAELKYVVSNIDQLVISAGVRFWFKP